MMVSIGLLSKANKSSLKDRVNSRELSRAKLFKEFLTDQFLTQTRVIIMPWVAIKSIEATILQTWL